MTIQTIGGAHMRRKLSLNFMGRKPAMALAGHRAGGHLSSGQIRDLVAEMID